MRLLQARADSTAMAMSSACSGDAEVAAPKVRLAAGLASFNRGHGGARQLSASIGAFSFDGGTEGSLGELMAHADAAMYEEKRARRPG